MVTSYQSAKGMEFEAVIMPEIELELDGLANEWYVACTRARRNLHIFCRTRLRGVLSAFPATTVVGR